MCLHGQHHQLGLHHSGSETKSPLHRSNNARYNFMLQKRPKKDPDNINLCKCKGEGEREGNHLFKTHEAWIFPFAIKGERKY